MKTMDCIMRIYMMIIWVSAVLASADHFENVALNKPCYSSSLHTFSTGAKNAGNGNTSGVYTANNCIHTAQTDTNPWWEVNLGRLYPVNNITIWARQGYLRRMTGCVITVDGHECYRFNTQPSNRDTRIQCTQGALNGSVIRVAKNTTGLPPDNRTINICEVQVFSCKALYWGSDCQQQCGHCNNSEVCDKVTGHCSHCSPGWTLPLCSQECTDGTFGDECRQNCSDGCQDVCNKATGNCTCSPGWQGLLCDIECPSGTYGPYCLHNCSVHCVTCDRVTGHCNCTTGYLEPNCTEQCSNGTFGDECRQNCSEGCQDVCNKATGNCTCSSGWQGLFCDTECPSGTYGPYCLRNCSVHCVTCDRATGHCTCTPGYLEPNCTEPCTNGTFGDNCSHACSERCQDVCDKLTGDCTCNPGWQGPACHACTDGTFGDNCSHASSEGCQDVCDKLTGNCTCNPGWQGPACHEVTKDEMQGNTDIGKIAGAAVGALVVVVVVALVVVFIIRRRRRSDKPTDQVTTPNDIDTRSGSRPEARSGSKPMRVNQDEIYQNILMSPENPVAQTIAEEGLDNGSHTKPKKHPPQKQARQKKEKSQTKPPTTKPARQEIYQNVGFSPDNLDPAIDLALGIQNQSSSVTPTLSVEGEEEVEDYETEGTEGEKSGDANKNEHGVYYNDDVYMTSQGSDLKLDRVQQFLLDKLRGDDLDEEFQMLPKGLVRPHDTGADPENYYRNRFRPILPYEDTRVVLRGIRDSGSNDYINASYVRGHHSPKDYIASQGPKTNTLGDFWKMVWQDHVTHIVMLTNIKEGKKKKCDVYWPASGTTQHYGSIEVTGLEVCHRSDYVIRTFDVRVRGEAGRHVSQYHYVTWPDHGVPTSTGMVNFWRFVSASHRHHNAPSPLLVHCSAGVGRTGTYIALDTVMNQLQQPQQQQQQRHPDILQTVMDMRHDRCDMIQTKSQYRMLHEALLEAYTGAQCQIPLTIFGTAFSHNIDLHHTHPRIDTEYQKLKQMKVLMPKPNHTEAEMEENINKNRAMDTLPDDDHLVRLTIPAPGCGDYINAVYFPTFSNQTGFIVTQLPMKPTVVDLWRLVAEQDVRLVVSLGDIKDFKTNCYWPTQTNKSETFGPITVHLTSESSLGKHLTQYTLSVMCEGESHQQMVKVLHYKDWQSDTMTRAADLPDPSDLADLVHRVITSDTPPSDVFTTSPVLLQCKNGASKSGLFGVMCNVISRMTSEEVVDVYMAVKQAQLVRPTCVTSQVQYRYIYQVVQEYRKRNEIYCNV